MSRPFPKEVDSDDDVDVWQTGIDDLRSLNRIDFRVQMGDLHAHSVEIGGDLLSELDGHHGDQTSLALLDTSVDFCEQIVDLAGRWAYFDLRVEQTCRTQVSIFAMPRI